MSMTGYDRQIASDIRRAADSLENIAAASMLSYEELKRIRLEFERLNGPSHERGDALVNALTDIALTNVEKKHD